MGALYISMYASQLVVVDENGIGNTSPLNIEGARERFKMCFLDHNENFGDGGQTRRETKHNVLPNPGCVRTSQH